MLQIAPRYVSRRERRGIVSRLASFATIATKRRTLPLRLFAETAIYPMRFLGLTNDRHQYEAL